MIRVVSVLAVLLFSTPALALLLDRGSESCEPRIRFVTVFSWGDALATLSLGIFLGALVSFGVLWLHRKYSEQ